MKHQLKQSEADDHQAASRTTYDFPRYNYKVLEGVVGPELYPSHAVKSVVSWRNISAHAVIGGKIKQLVFCSTSILKKQPFPFRSRTFISWPASPSLSCVIPFNDCLVFFCFFHALTALLTYLLTYCYDCTRSFPLAPNI